MQRRNVRNAGAMLIATIVLLAGGRAQDSRTVTEPVFPASCAVLTSQLGIVVGEPTSETAFDTARIQSALNACPAGQAVELQASGANNAFLIQPLTLPTGVTLLVDGGVTVFASRNPADYQIAGHETCGTVGSSGNGCNPIFNVNGGAASSGAGIMGYGVIDGRGEDKLLVNGVASANSWWDVANQAQSAGGAQNNPITLAASHAGSFTLYKITFKNSPMFHVKWQSADGFTAWGVKVMTPYTARNSDGIDPSGTNITVTRSSISDGDDNVALSASSATANVTISNNNTYSGHGISVGSYTQGGLTNMLVTNINQAGTAQDTNGIALRIKSALDRGGLVQNVTYRNICMQNHKTLIDIDPFYNANAGTLVPQFSNILFQNVHGLTAGTITLEGRDVNHPTGVTLDNFVFDNLTQANLTPGFQFDTITLGPGPVAPAFLQSQTGSGVSYSGNVSLPNEAPYACSAANFTFLTGELFLSAGSVTNAQTLTNVPGPGTVTLNAVVQPTMSQVTYGAYTGMPAPTAAVQFFEGTTQVGTASLGANGSLAALTLTGVKTGSHTYTAVYPGDATYAAYAFGSVTVMVIPTAAPSTTVLTVTPATVQAGSSTVLAAVVTGTSLAASATGTVNFFDGSTNLGSAMLNASGGASISAVLNGPGTHMLSAIYLGDPNNATSTSPNVAETVTAIPTTTVVGAPSSSVAAGSMATITAFVTSAAGVPVGTVSFANGTTVLGTAALVNGSASLATTSSSVATQTLSASYAASGNYAGSSSGGILLNFVAPVSLSASTYAVSLASGASSTVTLTATPAASFTGTVNVTCASPVSYVTCSLAPAALVISGTAAAQTTLTLNVAATTSFAAPMSPPGSHRGAPVYAFLPLGALVVLGLRRRIPLGVIVLLSITIGLVSLSGCASSNTTPPAANKPPVGVQTVTITAAEGALTQTSSILVSITD